MSNAIHAAETDNRPHVVILGAGFGGLYAARELKDAPVRITVIDRRNHHLFQPLLYQVATAGLSPGDIAYPIRSVLRHQKNTDVLLAEAVAIDTERQCVQLRDGDLSYDYLIVATGATHSYFGHDDWEEYAPGLKTLEDALEIRRRILLAYERAEREPDPVRREMLLTFVIVGGGPTGVELAGAIAEIARKVLVEDFRVIDPRESRIVLVEAGPRILAAYPEDLSQKAANALYKMGVEMRTHTAVTAIGEEMAHLGDESLPAGTIIWAAGVAASPLAQSLRVPLDRAGRVTVESDLSLPGHSNVFVIGDLALFTHQAGKPLPGVAPVALQQGRHAAHNILRRERGEATVPFHYLDKGSLATIGRARAVAQIGKIKLSGFVAWVLWLLVHILYLIGFRNRFIVMAQWTWGYLSMQKAARLITGPIEMEPLMEEEPAWQGPSRRSKTG